MEKDKPSRTVGNRPSLLSRAAPAKDHRLLPRSTGPPPLEIIRSSSLNRERLARGGSMNFNSILIGTEDPKRLKDYYSKLFGKPSFEDEAYSSWQIGSGFVSVGPHDEVQGKNSHPGRIIWNIETPNVKEEFDRLKAAGATVIKDPYKPSEDFDMWIATFADPDENYFQIQSPMEEMG
jgi:predicted enzyme related to lactoylglutathione lyase